MDASNIHFYFDEWGLYNGFFAIKCFCVMCCVAKRLFEGVNIFVMSKSVQINFPVITYLLYACALLEN